MTKNECPSSKLVYNELINYKIQDRQISIHALKKYCLFQQIHERFVGFI